MTRVIRHSAAAPHFAGGLESRLPRVRGRMTPNGDLRRFAWLGAGGPAEVLLRPQDRQDLADFIAACPPGVPVTVLGVMSNTLVRDGGIPGVVVRLGRDFAHIAVDGDTVTAGAGALDVNVAQAAARAGVGGLEFLSGIPGTVGGGLRMNAGAYGAEFRDVLLHADVLLRDGTVRKMTARELGMSYRASRPPAGAIFLGCTFKGRGDDPAAVAARIMEIRNRRAQTQPIRTKTGGSTFANPEDGRKAWELIDSAGCRGLRIGGAQMSEMHCNFMINTGDATAADLERLGEEVRRRVFDRHGVMLRWELRRVGVPLPGDADIAAFMERSAGEAAHGEDHA